MFSPFRQSLKPPSRMGVLVFRRLGSRLSPLRRLECEPSLRHQSSGTRDADLTSERSARADLAEARRVAAGIARNPRIPVVGTAAPRLCLARSTMLGVRGAFGGSEESEGAQ